MLSIAGSANLHRDPTDATVVIMLLEVRGQPYVHRVYLEKFVKPEETSGSLRRRLLEMGQEWWDKLYHAETYIERACKSSYTYTTERGKVNFQVTAITPHEMCWEYTWQEKIHQAKVSYSDWEIYISHFGKRGLSPEGLECIRSSIGLELERHQNPRPQDAIDLIHAFTAGLPEYRDQVGDFVRHLNFPLTAMG